MTHLIPSRTNHTGGDLIFGLHQEAEQRRRAGEPVINATIGSLMNDDGSIAILPTATKILQSTPPANWAAYAPIAGTKDFIAAVIDDVLATRPTLKNCAVAVATPGGTGALRLAISNYLDVGQAFLVSNHYWPPYKTLCDESGRTLTTYKAFTPEGTYDVPALGETLRAVLAKQGRALVCINDPCTNPTGYSLTIDEWRAVVKTLLAQADKPITLLVDMAYWLYSASEPRAFLAELEPLLGKVGLLFSWSASKSFTHYGLRVGSLIACEPDETRRAQVAGALAYSTRGNWSNCVHGGQWAIQQLLAKPELRAACDKERNALRDLLGRRVVAFNTAARGSKLRYPRYEGGFFVTLFHDKPADVAGRMKEQGVYAVPFPGGVRIALCSVPEKDISKVVAAAIAAVG